MFVRTVLASLVITSCFAEDIVGQKRETEALAKADSSELTPNDREGKFFSVFQIVKFENGVCTTQTGDFGTCYTEKECKDKGGVASGPCASSFGVCCQFVANTCGSTISENNGYIQSPGYPSTTDAGTCSFTIEKCDSNICQYRFVFEDVMLSDPMMGDCTNDTVSFFNLDPPSTATVPASLCGMLSGQEMYVTVAAATVPAQVVFNIAQMGTSKYKIRVEQIECGSDMEAPPGCLTYATGTTGDITSYNIASGSGELINNQKFAHCIKYQEGYCDVALTASTFDIGSGADGDMMTIGTNAFSGSTFGTNMMVTWNFTGPYVIPFCSDAMNTASNIGYDISYLLLPC